MDDLAKERVLALDIAISLMRRHLEAATPGGAGRESNAYRIATTRILTLQILRDEIANGP